MTWIAWRQHRAELSAAALGLALLAAIFVPFGFSMRAAFSHDGLNGCLLAGLSTRRCALAEDAFIGQFRSVTGMVGWFNFLPFMLGALIGAPLVAREIERGTHRLAWTQSVSRTHWIVVQIALAGAGVAAAAYGFTLLMSWWLAPSNQLNGLFNNDVFDFHGIAAIGYALFAFGLAALLGAAFRRILPAIALTLPIYAAARLVIQDAVRPHFIAPLTRTVSSDSLGSSRFRNDWIISQSAPSAHARGPSIVTEIYQPASRFWAFQGIETALFTLAAVAFLAITVWLVRRWRS